MNGDDFIDYYDFLMISPTADRQMVEWAARLMLARYGKKNEKTGDPRKCEIVKEAYRVLSDPARRRAFDDERAERRAAAETPEPSRELVAADGSTSLNPDAVRVRLTAKAEDVRLQQAIRAGMMAALYDVAITRPRNPELGRAEISRAIGARNDELEFAAWYLREREFLRTTAQGLYSITSLGVDWVESGGLPHLARQADRESSTDAEADQPGRPPAVAGLRRVL